jgi:hypothetical protein
MIEKEQEKPMLTVAWFSAGVSSAVATKLACPLIDRIIYQHIDDQHPDTMRFVKDCEQWFGKPVEILQSPLKSVENACRQTAFINGPHGASCTRLMKRRLRMEWEERYKWTHTFRYVWGLDSKETKRANGLRTTMPDAIHIFPLMERGLSKADAHGILQESGIARPAMYDLGYPNNNCIACVKGGMGYWNKIRVDFPEIFEARAKLERLIGHSCINGTFLDELSPSAGRDCKIILQDCDAMCEAALSEFTPAGHI